MRIETKSLPLQPAEFRRACASRPLRPYEALMPGDRWSAERERQAKVIVTEGWRIANLPRVRLEPPIQWAEVYANNRSAHYHLHAWAPLGPVLTAYEKTGEREYLDFAASVAVDWVVGHAEVGGGSSFAWYDQAVGLRAYRLGYIIDVVARLEEFPDGDLEALLWAALLHRDALADEASFAAHSNHGIYQAAGERAISLRFPELPGMREAGQRAERRLHRLLAEHFVADGMHREHSPGYQWFMAELLGRLLEAGLVDPAEFEPAHRRAEAALAWLLLPNGRFVMFGDTPYAFPEDVTPHDVRDPSLRYVLSAGQDGEAPAQRVRGFDQSGYFVARDWSPVDSDDFARCSYLAQICSFHSRAHKHADDLSFIWYERGRELLTDAGRYGFLGRTKPDSELWRLGFNYSDPKRVYVESTRAHNTVEIDGRSHPRRDVKPYGSALLQYGEIDGVVYSESQVVHHRSVRHARLLLFRPGEWLIVFDWLGDTRRRPHRYLQSFHFAPELKELEVAGSRVEVALPDEADRLHVLPLLGGSTLGTPVRGQEEPELLGWVSRGSFAMTPAWSVGYLAEGAHSHVFATLLSLSQEAPEVEPANESDPAGRQARLAWRVDGRRRALRFSRAPGRDFRLEVATDLVIS